MKLQEVIAPPENRIKIKLVKTGHSVEIAPGSETEVSIPREAVPRYGFVQLMRQNDGSYLPVLKTWSETIRMRSDTPSALGLDIGSVNCGACRWN